MPRLFIYLPLFSDLFPDSVWVVTGCHWLSRDVPGKGWCYKGPDITVEIKKKSYLNFSNKDIINVENGLYDEDNDLVALRIDFSVCE